ncbi:MAG TPA: NAD(P)H-dependent oxidoreductase [Candidatus Nitrosocosmicus sp.]
MEEISGFDIQELNLLNDIPDMLFGDNLLSYIRRNIGGQILLPYEEKLLSKMDRMTAQLKSTDIVVIAFPMYNCSIPSIVKAWFDSVMQKTVMFGKAIDDHRIISNVGKKALTLVTCGSVYSNGSFPCWEHTILLSNIEFQYMGYSDVRGILSEGMAMDEAIKQTNLNKAIRQVRAIAREWYKKR